MTTPATRSRPVPARALKSPLAAPGKTVQADAATAASDLAASAQSPLSDRESTLAEFEGYLRTVNNRDGRPYEEKTISVYSVPAKNLDGWLTANGIEGDFTVADTALLNRYFREYYLAHGQGGTHTLQRNLIQLFNFLERERGCATPYTDGLNRYAAVKGRPKTLSAEFVDDLLEITGSGRARDFESARDHAIIRILRSEGIRRAELLGMVMSTLPADVIKNPLFRLVPLKGARAAGEGRLVVPPDGGPLRRRRGQPACAGGQATARRHVLNCLVSAPGRWDGRPPARSVCAARAFAQPAGGRRHGASALLSGAPPCPPVAPAARPQASRLCSRKGNVLMTAVSGDLLNARNATIGDLVMLLRDQQARKVDVVASAS